MRSASKRGATSLFPSRSVSIIMIHSLAVNHGHAMAGFCGVYSVFILHSASCLTPRNSPLEIVPTNPLQSLIKCTPCSPIPNPQSPIPDHWPSPQHNAKSKPMQHLYLRPQTGLLHESPANGGCVSVVATPLPSTTCKNALQRRPPFVIAKLETPPSVPPEDTEIRAVLAWSLGS